MFHCLTLKTYVVQPTPPPEMLSFGIGSITYASNWWMKYTFGLELLVWRYSYKIEISIWGILYLQNHDTVSPCPSWLKSTKNPGNGRRVNQGWHHWRSELRNFILLTHSKTFKPNFIPIKMRESQKKFGLKANKIDTKATTAEQIQKISLFMTGFKTELCISFWNLPPKYFSWAKLHFPHTFYPNLPKNLHRYICHICDILQLCWRC